MQWVALGSALSAAVAFGVSSSLQHHAAESAPASVTRSHHLLAHLARRPGWLIGQALALAAFGLHALALHSGALALVQPIVVSGIVFAVPLRAAIARHLPQAGEVLAVAVTATGLAAFLVVSDPVVGSQPLDRGTLALVFTGVALAVALLVHRVAGGRWTSTRRASLLGITAGILFGLVAGLLKLTLDMARDDGAVAALTAWPVWTLIVVGLSGVTLNQRAYRAGALSASMPILNIVNVLVALGFGLVVFHEVPVHSAGALMVEVLSLVCVAWGLRALSASPELSGVQPVP